MIKVQLMFMEASSAADRHKLGVFISIFLSLLLLVVAGAHGRADVHLLISLEDVVERLFRR